MRLQQGRSRAATATFVLGATTLLLAFIASVGRFGRFWVQDNSAPWRGVHGVIECLERELPAVADDARTVTLTFDPPEDLELSQRSVEILYPHAKVVPTGGDLTLLVRRGATPGSCSVTVVTGEHR